MNKFILLTVIVLLLVFFGVVLKHRIQRNEIQTPISTPNIVTEKPKIESTSLPKSYEEALIYAKTKNKKLLVFFHADYCSVCDKMNQETLKNKEVLKALKNNICLIYYINVDKEPLIAKKYNISVVPVYYVVDADETHFANGLGFKDPKAFVAWLAANKLQ